MENSMRQFLKNQAGNLYTAILELTLTELEEALKVAQDYSPTNCWFVEFHMKEVLIPLIAGRIRDLKLLNKTT